MPTWTIHFTEIGCGVIRDERGEDIAYVLQAGANQTEAREAEGNLMVSAPIMYVTLHKLQAVVEAGGNMAEVREILASHAGAVLRQIKLNNDAQKRYEAEFMQASGLAMALANTKADVAEGRYDNWAPKPKPPLGGRNQ